MKKYVKKGLLILSLCIYFTCNTFAITTHEVKQNIIKQAKSMGVEPEIVLSIAKVESGFRQNIKSSGGHVGVFQLSPATAKNMGYDPYKLDENIKAGITYYKNMYNKFGSIELAVAAYNSGPVAVSRNKNQIPKKSRPFVSKIMRNYKHYKEQGL